MFSIDRTSTFQTAEAWPTLSFQVRSARSPVRPPPPRGGGAADSPVVLIHGPRSCGKTALVVETERRDGHAFVTFDDPVPLASAREAPNGFLNVLPEQVILDEVQRVPALFAALKARIGRDRRPGGSYSTGRPTSKGEALVA